MLITTGSARGCGKRLCVDPFHSVEMHVDTPGQVYSDRFDAVAATPKLLAIHAAISI